MKGISKTKTAPGEAFDEMVSDRGSTPLASTIKSKSENEELEASKQAESKKSFLKAKKEFLEMITSKITRRKLNRYIYEVEMVKKYLPHLNLDNFGRNTKKNKK